MRKRLCSFKRNGVNLPALPVDEVIESPSGGHLDDGECVNERERVCAGGKECVQERETVCAGEGESVYRRGRKCVQERERGEWGA